MKPHHFTFLGQAEYFGETYIYDGHDSPQCEGPMEEVIAYLENLKQTIPESQSALVWHGQNGCWYSGKTAIEIINGEISVIKEDEEISSSGS